MLSEINNSWLRSFIDKNGYRPRVLHIGNIANNAYNNAKLLNQAGLDCDVICHSYFHIMGYPEWEDADLKTAPVDHFQPEWYNLDYGNFKRPRWFAQGYENECIEYLTAKRKGKIRKSEILWNVLLVQSKIEQRHPIYTKKPQEMLAVSWKTIILAWRKKISKKLRSLSFEVRGNMKYSSLAKVFRVLDRQLPIKTSLNVLSNLVKFLLRNTIRITSRAVRQAHSFAFGYRVDYDRFIDLYRSEFEERADPLTKQDFEPYAHNLSRWNKLIDEYDIIIGYAVDPIKLLLLGKPYFAFEHGTIRDIPYETTPRGRLTALAYRKSNHVFVTNSDCINSANYLAPGRFTPINHPYDEDHGLSIKNEGQLREELLLELDCNFLFFHPTRQDWVEDGRGFADKGNDLFLRAFGEARMRGLKVGLVCCDWGENITQSKDLLMELNCYNNVKWVSPMAIVPFERMCLASDIVVDQFILGAFGGVFFKAMSMGIPIMTYLNEASLLEHYPMCPPVINCRTTEDILKQIEKFASNPGQLSNLGEAGRRWIKEFHAKVDTVNLQVDQFRMLLDAKSD